MAKEGWKVAREVMEFQVGGLLRLGSACVVGAQEAYNRRRTEFRLVQYMVTNILVAESFYLSLKYGAVNGFLSLALIVWGGKSICITGGQRPRLCTTEGQYMGYDTFSHYIIWICTIWEVFVDR